MCILIQRLRNTTTQKVLEDKGRDLLGKKKGKWNKKGIRMELCSLAQCVTSLFNSYDDLSYCSCTLQLCTLGRGSKMLRTVLQCSVHGTMTFTDTNRDQQVNLGNRSSCPKT